MKKILSVLLLCCVLSLCFPACAAERVVIYTAAEEERIAFLQQEREALPVDPAWVEGAICNGLFLYHPLAAFPNLRYLQLTSAGFDRVPMDAVKSSNCLFAPRSFCSYWLD